MGESGSAKSVLLRTLLRLHAPARTRISGSIHVKGQDVLALSSAALCAYRGNAVAMVSQEPGLAFDPVYTIGQQIAEFVRAHEPLEARAARQRALDLLERVQIPQAAQRLRAYPHELSGGIRQRARIVLALACRPKLLLAATVGSTPRGQPLAMIAGAPPDLAALPSGCAFAPRCSRAMVDCEAMVPPLQPEAASAVACWHPLRAPTGHPYRAGHRTACGAV